MFGKITASNLDAINFISKLILSDEQICDLLQKCSKLGMREWALGGGALRNLIWDCKYYGSKVDNISDFDIVYFGGSGLPQGWTCRGKTVEFKDQSTIHNNYRSWFGKDFAAFKNINESVQFWSETATCIAAYMHNGKLELITPYGIDDLMEGVFRPNPNHYALVPISNFDYRLASTRILEKYPSLTIVRDFRTGE